MKIKQSIIGKLKSIGIIISLFLVSATASAQCNITTTAPVCVNSPVQFFSNSPGASNVTWNFNGEGTSNQNDPAFTFATPGSKTITLSLKTATGQNCNTSLIIVVYPSPIIKLERINSKTQCFLNNSFCFVDSSSGGVGGIPIKSIKYAFDDGELITASGDCNNGGVKMPRTFCKSFSDPQGGTYGMTIEIENCYGCITKIKLDKIAIVRASLGLKFISDKPRRCDSAVMTVTNQSTVPFDSVKSWSWDWGDGTFNTTQWGPKVKHTFYSQGPNGGDFNSKLTVTTKDGCTESFTFNASAYNLVIKPIVLATKDSACLKDADITFSLKGGAIPGGTGPIYTYEDPRGLPANFTRGWVGSHKFGGLGPHKVTFSYQHPVPGCGKTVFDTILVIGPKSTIEGSIMSGMRFIEDTMRYQCIITDTVKFYNFSKFYHNDKNNLDDDSLILVYDSIMVNKTTSFPVPTGTTFNPAVHAWVYPGFNKPLVHAFTKDAKQVSEKHYNQQRGNSCTQRLWDFDDDFCEKCTTDTKNGVNVGKNCKFSKDSLPQHWYTPWDSVYMTDNGLRSEKVLNYSKDSGLCYQRNLWSSDSIAIIRDTILYYGDNALAKKTKDSIIYKNIKKKVMVGNYVKGPWRYDMTVATKFFLKAGNRVYNDLNNGNAPNAINGQRYFTIQQGNSLVILTKNDSAFYNVWLEYIQDTIPKHLIQPWHKVWKKELVQGFKTGDSVNAAAHRQKFYAGTTVRCFNVRLNHKDFCHTLKCEDEAIASLALQPPSAKKLRKLGTQCLGGDQDNYGITFVLEDTKPGCSRTFAKINFDTALNKLEWKELVGANLTPGKVSAGNLPPISPPYQVPIPGYQVNGPAGSRFSKQFTVDDIKDSITGYINVGLIVGNGIWKDEFGDDLPYPDGCIDTIYYPKFARFPFLDNRFRIIKPKEGKDFTKICRKDTICLALLPRNRTYVPDVAEATWTLEGANVGKFYNQYYRLDVVETYSRFQKIAAKDTIPGDYKKLGDYITVRKSVFLNSPSGSGLPPIIDDETLDSQKILVSRVEKWHTEADITPVFDIIKTILQRNNIDVYELSPAQLAELIWNGKGTFGVPYTKSRGCLDTTGFGRFIRFYKVADQKQILHYRDFSLSPIEEAKVIADTTTYLDTCSCNELGTLNAQWLTAGGLAGTGKDLRRYIFDAKGGIYVSNPDSLVLYCKKAIVNVQQDTAKYGTPKKWIPGVTKWNAIGKEYIDHLARENNWRAPIQFKCINPKITERSYCFVPQFSGYYVANYGLRSIPPENCTKQTGTAKKVIVGFYGAMNYNDTILCHGQTVTAEPQFRYFNVYPELGIICNITGTPLLDCIDYWRNRISEAGNINREGVTRWDLSKADDGTDPKSIFGGFPYSYTGLGKPNILELGGISAGGIYYLKDTGDVYHIRTAASDSFGCKDTFPQDVYVSAVRAKFSLDQKRPQCNTIIELFDSSYIMDPCRGRLQNNDSCDWIVKWTINWGDGQKNSINSFFLGNYPPQVGHDYTRNGAFKAIWRVETHLGCVDYDTIDIYIPGPIPFFDTFIPRKYCVNEKVNFKNLSKYIKRDSSTWLWQFGDGFFDSQFDTITPANDTINHRYTKPGRYAVYLRHFFKLQLGTLVKNCSVVYPDTLGGQQPIFYIDVIAYDTVKLISDKDKICPGDAITFRGTISPSRYPKYRWSFGLSATDTLITADSIRTQQYKKEGKYTVKFMGDVSSFPTTDKICPGEDSVKIEVYNVVADFDIDTTKAPVFCLNNKSTGATKYQWGLYGGKDVMAVNPASARGFKIDLDSLNAESSKSEICKDYRDSVGEYWVCLEAINDIGCKDTICKKLVNNFEAAIRPPNVFTPNNGSDGYQGLDKEGLPGNDVFNIEIKGEEKYDLVIYDRWGVRVFESTDKKKDWNGKVNNTGANCPDGTYYYILKYRYKGKEKDEPVLNGIVQIIRGQ